jgi:hypothetical protein
VGSTTTGGDWRQRRRAGRVQGGDGRALAPFRWWQLPSRALLSLTLRHPDGRQAVYAVDVPQRASAEGGKVRAHLYLDGVHHAESTLPAAFPVEGGTIEVALRGFGIARGHYVTDAGAEHPLVPDPRSAEGRRDRIERDHPALSRAIDGLSLVVLVVGVVAILLQIAEPISAIPPIADTFGRFRSPIHLPLWLDVALGIGAGLASAERALRRRSTLLDRALS